MNKRNTFSDFIAATEHWSAPQSSAQMGSPG